MFQRKVGLLALRQDAEPDCHIVEEVHLFFDLSPSNLLAHHRLVLKSLYLHIFHLVNELIEVRLALQQVQPQDQVLQDGQLAYIRFLVDVLFQEEVNTIVEEFKVSYPQIGQRADDVDDVMDYRNSLVSTLSFPPYARCNAFLELLGPWILA